MKHKLSKIIAGLTALLLIVLVLTFANSLVGNPISKAFASRDIKTYLATTYPDTDYELDNVHFNFKFHEYYGTISSPSSKDSSFTVTWRSGKVLYDSYDFDVTQRQNTIVRYETEVCEQIRPLLASIPELNIAHMYVSITKEYYESDLIRSLVLDTPYDKSMKLPFELSISCDMASPTLEEYASFLEQIHATLTSHGYHMDYYSMDNSNVEEFSLYLDASNVSPEEIEGGKLLSLLEEALNKEDDSSLGKGPEDTSNERQLYVHSWEK